MKQVLATGLAGAIVCMPSIADIIRYDGQDYETIRWEAQAELGSDGLAGAANGVSVLFSSVMSGDPLASYDYSSEAEYDGLTYGDGIADSVSILGGESGKMTMRFSRAVDSALLFFGAPAGTTGSTEFGASIWDFDDSLEMRVINSRLDGGFHIGDGNILTNPNSDSTTQNGGIIGVWGDEMTSIEWLTDTSFERDKMQFTVAVSIPAPASGLALLLPIAICAKRRR